MRPEVSLGLTKLFRPVERREGAVVVNLAEVHRGERELVTPERREFFEREPPRLKRDAPVPPLLKVALPVDVPGRLAPVRFAVALDEVADGEVRGDAARRDARLPRGAQEDVRAAATVGDVAPGPGEYFDEATDGGFESGLAHQLDGAARVPQRLQGLDAGDVVEEPAAARVHRQRRALRFEQSERAHLLVAQERVRGVPAQELFARGRAVN